MRYVADEFAPRGLYLAQSSIVLEREQNVARAAFGYGGGDDVEESALVQQFHVGGAHLSAIRRAGRQPQHFGIAERLRQRLAQRGLGVHREHPIRRRGL